MLIILWSIISNLFKKLNVNSCFTLYHFSKLNIFLVLGFIYMLSYYYYTYLIYFCINLIIYEKNMLVSIR